MFSIHIFQLLITWYNLILNSFAQSETPMIMREVSLCIICCGNLKDSPYLLSFFSVINCQCLSFSKKKKNCRCLSTCWNMGNLWPFIQKKKKFDVSGRGKWFELYMMGYPIISYPMQCLETTCFNNSTINNTKKKKKKGVRNFQWL